ncbi:MAG: HlyD family efflux transporter periplasmic adaptor subunit [Nostoc sp. NMS1]|uniref:HlyD family efflux transporter periplasmic adaptor subunit n=1 Tax=unclassified Nostoc TaxID=2593658 RepID=UPI0025F7765A|nr:MULTISPECIES: HlyD family efflux transporter periplasmic adaptor subunit [unclassified Nostoc]MBN3906109.1 HlyD family efflux transporter periplasmic adaptor subunit [Nostoc sp. NMS1]MBN3991847.1 HlyD family efflux transporter periplasmic adaptor subunit [Nostoc sp. NMS2]
MTNILNGRGISQIHEHKDEDLSNNTLAKSHDDWSFYTKELLDGLPKVWTRGLLYFLIIFVSIILPWAMLSKVDETGTARGRIEPKGKTLRLDAAVSGTVTEIRIKEGDAVKSGQKLLVLDSELVKKELQQVQDKLEGQLNRRSQLNLSQNQLVVALTTQQQQNQSQELEKQSQIDQARQNLIAIANTYELQKLEKMSQVNQAQQNVEHSKTAKILVQSSLTSSQREEKRYHQLFQEGVIPETNFVEKQEIVKDKQKIYEQSQSDIQQSQLRLVEQQSSYQRIFKQGKADITQTELRVSEQERGYQTLTRSSKLALLKIDEQQKNLQTEITTLSAEIAQTKRQIESLNIQLAQRELKAPVSGIVFQLPIEKAGAVVQPGTMIAEIAPISSPFVIRAQMATNESGSLRKGLPVKLKFDAYPFQDYGIIEGELIDISPTTTQIDTANGKLAAYNLEITLKQNCIQSNNKCIPLRPGDTATAEVIVRQRRIIDFLLDPFKQLQEGGLKL